MSTLYRLVPEHLLGFTSRSPSGVLAPAGAVSTAFLGGGGNTAPSPTGRDPTFIWTPEWQYTNELMQANSHWYWVAMLDNANKTGTTQQRFNDNGQYCTYVYQVTGDVSYATKAWTRLSAVLTGYTANFPVMSDDGMREDFGFMCILVDWLWPALNATQRQQAMDQLKICCDYCQGYQTPQYRGGLRPDDSDPLFGYYIGFVALHYFNVPQNSLYGVALTRNANVPAPGATAAGVGPANYPMGGLDGPNAPVNSVRGQQYRLVTNFATGGNWFESSEYNHGTSQLAFLLWQVTKTATGTDWYPELAQYFADYQYRQWHEITPDFEQVVYWGDEQDPRQFNTSSFRYARYWGRAAIQTGALALAGYDEAASFGVGLSEAFYANNATYLTNNQNGWDRTFLGFNPYLPATTLPTTQSAWWCDGMDMQYVKDDRSLFWSYTPQRMGVDHNIEQGAHFQLYRDGSWVVRQPIAYDTSSPVVQWSNDGVNSVILAGLNRHCWDRGLVRHEEGADWWATTSQTNGSYWNPALFDPPPSFVNSCERRIVYFKENGFDVVVVRDVIDAVDPRTLPKLDRYRTSNPNEQALIAAQDAVKVVVFHSETEPNISSQVATWTSDGTVNGGVVTTTKCHTLLPAAATLWTVDESSIYAGQVDPTEAKWQLRVKETSEQQVTTFLHVIISGNGTQPAISNASASGVTIGSRVVTFGTDTTTVGSTLDPVGDVMVDDTTTYQTMRGWEVTAQAGDDQANYSVWRDQVMTLAGEWGVDAVRLEIKANDETSSGVYNWTALDAKVNNVVLPLKAAVEAAGRTLHINLCYVAFSSPTYQRNTTSYANYVLAAVQRLDTTHGLTVDAIEVILEPDNATWMGSGSGPIVGQCAAAAGALLASNGYTPEFIVPSTTNMANAVTFFTNARAQTGAATYISMLSYHRYGGVSDANLAAIKAAAASAGCEVGQLEWIGATAETLYKDLTLADCSYWQQYTLAYPSADGGQQLFPITGTTPAVGSRTYGLGQYFKYVRRGAERVGCTSSDGNVRPVAFINPDGKAVVVLHVDAPGTYTIGGLSPSTNHDVTRATVSADASDLGTIATDAVGVLSITVPSASIVTVAEL